MLQWVLFAQRSLKPEELFFAVLAGVQVEELRAWNQSDYTFEMIKKYITHVSKGLIEVQSGDTETVQFIHKSVNDFLLRNKRLQKLVPTIDQHAIRASHDRLLACCTSYIMMDELELLVNNKPSLPELAFSYPFLGYASTFILYHAENAQHITQQSLIEQLNQPSSGFERLRSIHDVFQGYISRYGVSTKLLYAISSHGCYELLQLVLGEGADVNARGGVCGNALQAASSCGNEAVVALLLKQGADVNMEGGIYGNTLQTASGHGHEAIVALLLEKGANANARGGFYNSALQAAIEYRHKAIIELLLDKGADINVQGGYYGNALQNASELGDTAVVELLLRGGADINTQGGYYSNALEAASHKGRDEVVKLLVESGARR